LIERTASRTVDSQETIADDGRPDFAQGRIPARCMALLDLAFGDRERAVRRLGAAYSGMCRSRSPARNSIRSKPIQLLPECWRVSHPPAQRRHISNWKRSSKERSLPPLYGT
jgi:hypothetical protein